MVREIEEVAVMSRIQEALKRAEEQRAGRTPSAAAPKDGAVTPEALDDEVRRLELSLSAWRARPAEPASTPPLAQTAAVSKRAPPPAHRTGTASDSWETEICRCQDTLALCEQRLTQAHQQRAACQGQVAEQERVVAQATAHLVALQQRVQDAAAAVRNIEADRAAHGERLSALRQCQTLAQAAVEAEGQIQTNTETIARIARVQQRVTEKLSQHQQEAQELRAAAAELRRRLADTLARTQHPASPAMNGGGRDE